MTYSGFVTGLIHYTTFTLILRIVSRNLGINHLPFSLVLLVPVLKFHVRINGFEPLNEFLDYHNVLTHVQFSLKSTYLLPLSVFIVLYYTPQKRRSNHLSHIPLRRSEKDSNLRSRDLPSRVLSTRPSDHKHKSLI